MSNQREKKIGKLRESEERYRKLFEYSMDAAYITTPEGKVIDINQAGLELFGFNRDEFLKLDIPDLYVDPRVREKVGKILEEQGALRDFEYKLYRKDRTQITVRENCVAVRDEKGKIIMYYGILKDITPQKEVERKLSAIYDLSKEMSLSLDLDQISKFVLDMTKRVLNFDYIDLFLLDEEQKELRLVASEGWKERNIYERIPISGEKGITAYVARTGESLNVPDVRKDKRYLLSSEEAKSELCVPIKVKDKVIGVIDAESEELNVFSKEDQQLLETLASQTGTAVENTRLFRELSALKEFSETIVSSLNEGLWIEDEQGFCTYTNNKLNEMLGYEKLVGKHWREIVAPEELDHMRKETKTRQYGSKSSYESLLLAKNGEKIPVIVSATPLFEKRKFIGTIGVYIDIRQQKLTEEALKESEELYRSLSEFNKELLENSPVGIMNIDREMRVEYENPEMRRILGLPFGREELSVMGMNVREAHLIEEAGLSSEFDILTKGEKIATELTFTFPAGEKSYLTVRGVPLLEDGKFNGAVLIFNNISELKKAEELQTSIFKISEATQESQSLEELFSSIHAIIGGLMSAQNFFIALHNANTDMVNFPYYADEYDAEPRPRKLGRGATEYVLRTGKPLLANPAIYEELMKKGEIELIGTIPVDWLGVPLKGKDKIIGVLAIQSYTEGVRYSEEDKNILMFVSDQVALAIERKRTEESLLESKTKIEQLHKVATQMETAQSEEEVYQLIIDATEKVLEFDMCEVYKVEGNQLKVLYTSSDIPIEGGKDMSIDEGIAGKTYRTNSSFLTKDIRKEKNAKPSTGKYRSGISLPIGRIGVFQAMATKVGAFDRKDLEMGELLISHATEALKRIYSEKSLRNSEERYRNLVEQSPNAVFILNREGIHEGANKKASELLGYSLEEFKELSFRDIVVPSSIPDSEEKLAKLLRGEKLPSYEKEFRTKDGRAISVELSVSGIKEESGEIKHILSIARDITERKKAEEALQESEERFRSVVEGSHSGIFILDENYRFIYVNDELCRIGGYSREEITGHDFRKFLDEESKQLVVDRYVQRQRGEKISPRYEFNIIRKDGKKRRVEISSTVIRDSAGNVRTVAQIMDITERKKAEEELRQSEEKFRTLTENVNVGIYRNTVGIKGKFIEANPAIVQMFGYATKEEFLAANVSDLYQDPENRKKFNQKMLEKGFVRSEELLLKKKDGTPFYGSVTTEAVKDETGEVRYYDGIIEDITERKKAEKALRKSEERFKMLFERIPEATIYTDENIRTIGANLKFEELFGYSLDEIIGRNLNDLIIPEDKMEEAKRLDRESIKGGYASCITVRKRKDGSLVPVSISGGPVIIEGSKTGMMTVYKDITERKKAEDQREKARREAEFYADVLAHDIGNIDQITLGYLYLLKNAKNEKTRQKNMESIKKSIMKSARLTENIKILKKIEETKLEKISLDKSIERSIEKIKAYFDRKIMVNLDTTKKHYVNANNFLDKMFFNVLENAVEFTFHDPVVIDIKTEEKKGMCTVHIRDRGIGIPEEKKEDILKNLETLSKRTGVGLYLVKKILDRFNGKFEIKDAEKGTEVVISIPVKQ